MKKDLIELVFILDRSGSMSGLESDTIGGYNNLLDKQKNETGEAIITTVLFDNEYEVLHDRINIKSVYPITHDDYYVRGTTALLDAIGKTIIKISNAQKCTKSGERAGRTMFIITTDGMENSSSEFNYGKIYKMIETQKDEYGWEFLFLGANIDAISTAERFGINKDRATNFYADSYGMNLNFQVISETISNVRENKVIPYNWKSKIETDYEGRKSKRNIDI